MDKQLQNPTATTETIFIHGTSSHYKAVRQPFDLREKQSYLGC